MTDAHALLDTPAEIPVESAGDTRRPLFTRRRVGTALEVAGGLSVSGAAFGISSLLGWLTLGVGLIVFGVATELGGR